VTRPDIDRVTSLIEEAAAAEIMPRFQRLAAHDVREKAPGELVTIADEAVEARLAPLLAALMPGSLVLGEEAAAVDRNLLDHLLGEHAVWVIDPVDGTGNFAEGRPAFALMVALVVAGRIEAGWIHDPVGGRTATAAAGEGAWMGGRRLQVAAAPADPGGMSGVLLAGSFGGPELRRMIDRRRGRVRALRSVRSAGHEYLRLVAGEMHFALFTKLMPWDHAAGALLHREAGGHGRYLEGGAYEPAAMTRSGFLLAPDADSWERLYATLFGPD
jgi:fructose-1,6-bisphosphatase/inositol monophosphatase family enzyme